jgi:anti-anti-sigma regulatory factor/HAMP domain-containing protein
MLGKLKIRARIIFVLSLVAITAVGISGYITFSIARDSLEKESFKKLTAVREMKASQIEDYFQQIFDQITTLSEDHMVIEAMNEFKTAFNKIDDDLEITDEKMAGIDSKISDYYQNEFLQRLIPNLDSNVNKNSYLSKTKNTRILQDLYIASNPKETGSKHLLDFADDQSTYSKIHKKFHPVLRSYLEKFGFYDIFLVDHLTGHIVYTVFKEVDFGTSLLKGPYSKTNFAEAFRLAREASYKDYFKLMDYEPYHPSYNGYASFVASPIYDGDQKVGVLVFQMPVDRINDIMTSKQTWADMGLGESGETYIVGDDYMIRNQSRFLIEDSENYFNMIKKIGVSEKIIKKIRNANSTICLQKVKTNGTEAAIRGETGIQIFPDYRNISVLSSYKPLKITDVKWAIMSEIDKAEAFTHVNTLRNYILICFAGMIVIIIVVAFFFSRTITRPLRNLTKDTEHIAKGNLGIEIDTSGYDEIGDLAKSFSAMQKSIQNLVSRQEESIDALSSPLIPVHEEIVIMPLVGNFDKKRIEHVRSTLTDGLHESHAKVAILDLTGVPILSQHLVTGLIRTVRSAQLLGAQVVITGMQSEVAQQFVEHDVNLAGLVTERSLQRGISFGMKYIQNSH